MNSFSIHNVATVTVARDAHQGTAWTTIIVTDDKGIKTSVTLFHDEKASPLITQG